MAEPQDQADRPRADGAPPEAWFDSERLTRLADDSGMEVGEIVLMFFDETLKSTGDMERAIQGGHADAIRRLAHSCVGSGATCGMTALADLFRKIELAAGQGDVDRSRELFASVRSHLASTDAAIERWRARPQ